MARTLASSVLAQLLLVAQNYLLVPMFLSGWGNQAYGHWLSLTALSSYLALLDFGGSSYVGTRLAQAFAQDQKDEFRILLNRGFSLFVAIALGALLIVFGVVGSPFIAWDSTSRYVVLWTALATILGVPGGILNICYAATGRIVRSVMVNNAIAFTRFVLFASALHFAVSQPVYAHLGFLITVMATTVVALDLRRVLGELFRPAFSWGGVKEGRAMLRGSLLYWLFPLANALSIQSILLVIAKFEGNEQVALYATHCTVANLVMYAASWLRASLWTEMTFLAARSEMRRLSDLYGLAVRANTWISTVTAAGVCVAAPFAYSLWTRGRLHLDGGLVLILSLRTALSASWSTSSWPLISSNKPEKIALWSLVNGVFTLASSYAVARLGFGLHGVALANLAGDILCGMVPIPAAAAAFLRESGWNYVKHALRGLACASPFVLGAYASTRLFADDRVQIAAFTSYVALLGLPAAFLVVGRADFERIKRALRGRTT